MISTNILFKDLTKIITFPKIEWKDIKERLIQGKIVSTTRNSCGVKKKIFNVNEIYNTQWGSKIEIIKVEYFKDPIKIPTWNKMNSTMHKSIEYGIKMCGTDNLQWVHLKAVENKLPILTTPKELLKFMKLIKYDFHTDEEKYIIKSPEQLIQSRLGICYDEVELERIYFNFWKYQFKTFFIYSSDPKDEKPTHTFLIFKKNSQYFWFEHSWENNRGIHGPFKSYRNSVNFVGNIFKHSIGVKSVNVIDYNKPKDNLKIRDFGRNIIHNNNTGYLI